LTVIQLFFVAVYATENKKSLHCKLFYQADDGGAPHSVATFYVL